jgi:hypothetical protein
MAGGSGLRVYVLGAGCSFDKEHGYPLAKNFIPALSAYGTSISTVKEAAGIKQAVDYTVALLTGCEDAATIDQLINLILQHRCDDLLLSIKPHPANDISALRYLAVRRAKIATCGCFLDLEPQARKAQLDKYKRFIQEDILTDEGVSTLCYTRLRKSSARVLTFNYDRLFELAFFASCADYSLMNFGPYDFEVLNSGMTHIGKIGEVKEDRLCFLKLHGTIGTLCGDGIFGEEIAHVDQVAQWKPIKASDSWFVPKGPPPSPSPAPLIVFPYEKDYIVSGKDNKLAFRSYIKTVWDRAKATLSQASEIWVIGYSFDPTDCRHLVEGMKQASNCERVVIQNLPAECDRIERLLRTKYRLGSRIEKYEVPF